MMQPTSRSILFPYNSLYRSFGFRPEHPPIEKVVFLPKRPRRRKLRSFGHGLEFRNPVAKASSSPRNLQINHSVFVPNILRLKKSCFYRNALGAKSCDLSGTVLNFATQLPRHRVPHEFSRSIIRVSSRTSSD